MTRSKFVIGISILFVAGAAFSTSSKTSVPSSWKSIELPGVPEAWESSSNPNQTLTRVETLNSESMTFRGQRRDLIASGLIALRERTLSEFNITHFQVREFNYEDLGNCERVTLIGSYIRPENVTVQFIEKDVYQNRKMIQYSIFDERDKTPSDQAEHDQLLTTLATCDQ